MFFHKISYFMIKYHNNKIRIHSQKSIFGSSQFWSLLWDTLSHLQRDNSCFNRSYNGKRCCKRDNLVFRWCLRGLRHICRSVQGSTLDNNISINWVRRIIDRIQGLVGCRCCLLGCRAMCCRRLSSCRCRRILSSLGHICWILCLVIICRLTLLFYNYLI